MSLYVCTWTRLGTTAGSVGYPWTHSRDSDTVWSLCCICMCVCVCVCVCVCGYVKQEALMRQYIARGGTNKGNHHALLLLHKQVHDKKGIAELLHGLTNRAKLRSWYFHTNITSLENTPTPSLRRHSSSLPVDVFSRDYSTCALLAFDMYLNNFVTSYTMIRQTYMEVSTAIFYM